MIRTLVCASSDLSRAGLASVVRGDERLVLAGEADPNDVERKIATLDPDVLLLQCDGAAEPAHTTTVALVDDPRGAWANATFAAPDVGPQAILARDAPAHQIAAAIVAVAAGLIVAQPETLARAEHSPREADAKPLTEREGRVLSELARGLSNKTIAARLHISEHTVKFHIASIFSKLGVASRTEAVTHGVRLGLVML